LAAVAFGVLVDRAFSGPPKGEAGMLIVLALFLALGSAPDTAGPGAEVALSISRDSQTSSDRVTLCRVRATNQGPRSWAGRSIAFEARAYSATAVARERGRFGLVLEPYGTLETLVGFEGRFDRFEVVAVSGGRDHSRRTSRTPFVRKGRKPRG
jgi:hypothetical protein